MSAKCRATVLLAAGLCASAAADSVIPRADIGLSDQKGLNLTIYNREYTLVTDRRAISLVKGVNEIALRDVCAKLRPESTTLVNSAQTRDIKLIEQRFEHDILTPGNLLDKYVGHSVHVMRTDPQTGDEIQEEALVLSTRDGIVLKLKDRIETGIPARMVFAEMPPNLHDRPTLIAKLSAAEDGDYVVEFNYLCGGLSWQADYVAKLTPQENEMELSGWATISNATRSLFNGAQVRLASSTKYNTMLNNATASLGEGIAVNKRGNSPFEDPYALLYYQIPNSVSIGENQSLQVSVLNAKRIPVTKEYLFAGNDEYFVQEADEIAYNAAAQVRLRFTNNADAKLGTPLPSGVVRFYKNSPNGQGEFVNEDRIPAIARNEEINLNLSPARDVTINKWQTMFDIQPYDPHGNRSYLSGYRYTIKNGRDHPVIAVVEEPIPGEWEIVQESQPHRTRRGRCVWNLEIPPRGETALKFNVKVTP